MPHLPFTEATLLVHLRNAPFLVHLRNPISQMDSEELNLQKGFFNARIALQERTEKDPGRAPCSTRTLIECGSA
jgi:hypothetical protein